ncbi:hypothetical protein [Klenkia taihuensis]|uniref:Uncharacterized protein n=1 Tax=Klenkia taihuensis TaxID=1225127 RepID=A0A1I1HGF6_9ACTN|nr:hypothetical protein [Klenkia taihuensis]GHE09206.1 hypothetical protein GCM10011381_13060 [Klenkia taihuensis]SFC22795.1 hypothetical protein SAMN05661030_0429 [Klenkia taihuensis]
MTRDRAAERAFVRAHHPDVGGDPAVFVAGLAALRAGATATPGPVTVVATRRTAPARLLRRLRRARRAAQRSSRLD